MRVKNNNFFEKLRQQYDKGYPFVAFRDPEENVIKAYLQNSNKSFFTNTFTDLGFIFAPFDLKTKKILFIPKSESNVIEEPHPSLSISSFDCEISPTKLGSYKDLVEKSQQKMIRGIFKKVVLTRFITLKFRAINAVSFFQNLLLDYTNQYVYIWSHPLTGVWIGVSPEQFIRLHGNKLETVSLAGTQQADGASSPNWNEKEQEEHHIVTAYFQEKLQDKLKDLHISLPTNTKAGNLWHLKTSISGELASSDSLRELIKVLHPTPAVCGYPKQESMNFIKEHENYDRSFYTGFLGEVSISSTNLFVNIRCMQIEHLTGKVFVGAGITVASDSQEEWEETENKSQTIIRSLRIK